MSKQNYNERKKAEKFLKLYRAWCEDDAYKTRDTFLSREKFFAAYIDIYREHIAKKPKGEHLYVVVQT